MPVKTYLQTAISQVQTAMAEMEQQMSALQRSTDTQKQQLQSSIGDMEKERNLHMTEIGRLQNDSEKNMLSSRISDLNKQIEDAKSQISRLDSELGSVQKRKDELHRNLYNAIGELTRLSALPDIG